MMGLGDGTQFTAHRIIINMGGFTAFIAYQKDAIVLATGMAVGEEGIGAFDSQRQIIRHEQVQDAIDAVGRDTFAPATRQIIGNVISGHRAFMPCQLAENSLTHAGPLLTRIGQRGAGSINQLGAGMNVMCMIMSCHAGQYRGMGAIVPD